MTPEDIRHRLHIIAGVSWDEEEAHKMEDQLHLDVLGAIAASQCTEPKECALMALQSQLIKFKRWYG